MDGDIAFIGFGEAAQAFAALRTDRRPRAYDIKTKSPATRAAKRQDYARHNVAGQETATDALADAEAVLCVVTADQAVPAARLYAPLIRPGALWLDLNSVAPTSKRDAAQAVTEAGGRYVDVAVMAPVDPARLDVPLLVSGPHADAAVMLLTGFGFSKVRGVGPEIGAASAIKMIRSVMVKGLEALTAEWIIAAEAAGIRDEAVAALNASWPGTDWAEKADYNLDRMMVHGVRRAAEMEEVVKTLDALGTGSAMTRGTVERQRAIGELRIAPPGELDAKLKVLEPFHSLVRERAA